MGRRFVAGAGLKHLPATCCASKNSGICGPTTATRLAESGAGWGRAHRSEPGQAHLTIRLRDALPCGAARRYLPSQANGHPDDEPGRTRIARHAGPPAAIDIVVKSRVALVARSGRVIDQCETPPLTWTRCSAAARVTRTSVANTARRHPCDQRPRGWEAALGFRRRRSD